MENLKPCPFCGGKGKIKAAKGDHAEFAIWCECENCYAQSGGYSADIKNEDLAIENIDSCKNEAVEAWNRRASLVKGGGGDDQTV